MMICIDCGHGGKDPGAVGTKEQEKNITLKCGLRVKQILEANGLKVMTTRGIDEYITLADRCNKANKAGADLFISIHTNAADNKAAQGVETFVADKKYHTACDLAGHIQKSILDGTGRKDRGIKEAGFAVLCGTNMPAVLTEIGFISSAEEEAYMIAHIDDIAARIAKGIMAHVGLKKASDVSEWAAEAWEECTRLGIMDGTRPKENVTREQMAVIVSRLLKIGGTYGR